MNKCEICGYEVEDNSEVVCEYPDGFSRCKVCADIACHGKFLRRGEIHTASAAKLDQWLKEWREWIHRLASS